MKTRRFGRIALFIIAGGAALFFLIALLSPAASRLLAEGNEAFEAGNYMDALTAYVTAQRAAPAMAEPYYNAANALYRQDAYAEAIAQIESALSAEADATLTTHSYFNLGNSHYNSFDLQQAIAAYTEALRRDPADMDAKYNLELALQQLAQQTTSPDEQQEQQDENGAGDSEDEQEQESQDQAQNGADADEQESDADEQQQQENEDDASETSEQDEGDGDQPLDQPQNDDPTNADSANSGQPDDESSPMSEQLADTLAQGRLTEEEAEQILAAIAANAETLQERLNAIFIAPGPPPAEDW